MQVLSDIHQERREEVDPHDQLILGGDPDNHLDARHLIIEDHDLREPPSCQSAVVRFRNTEVVVLPSYFNLKCEKP